MDMVGHDDASMKAQPLTVEAEQAVLHDLTDFRTRERTRTVPGIKPRLQAFAETLVVFFPVRVAPRFGMVAGPNLAFGFPRVELFLWQGIGEA